jgi:hypothetical protein
VIITAKILVGTVCKAVLGLKSFVTGYSHSARLKSEGNTHTADGGKRVTVADLSPTHLGHSLSVTNPPDLRTRFLSRACKMLQSECAVQGAQSHLILKLNKILGLQQGKVLSRFGMIHLF